MLNVVETFSGIGAQSKALRRIGIEHQILNTVEWEVLKTLKVIFKK